jgi:threonine dehydrogenase-like Zn-dependent dehydrogenase
MSPAATSMPSTAAVLAAVGEPLELRRIPLAPPRAGDAVVAVEYGGICGTDLHIAQGHLPVPIPLVLGHEGIGVVERAEPGAIRVDGQPLTPGERVMWASSIACGRCWQCRVTREPTLCASRRTYGVNRGLDDAAAPGGAWSERMPLVAGTTIVPVPDDVEPLAAMSLACAGPTILHALDERRPIRRGETVVVQGAGPVGMAAAIYAQASGARRVVLAGGPRERIELAAQLDIGSDHVSIDGLDGEGIVRAVLADVGERGADLVIECTGVPDAIEQGLRMCRRGGSYLVVGQYTDAGPALITPHLIVHRQLDVHGSWAFTGAHLERYVASLPGLLRRHDLAQLVTAFPLVDVNAALAAVAAGTIVKAVLEPERS